MVPQALEVPLWEPGTKLAWDGDLCTEVDLLPFQSRWFQETKYQLSLHILQKIQWLPVPSSKVCQRMSSTWLPRFQWAAPLHQGLQFSHIHYLTVECWQPWHLYEFYYVNAGTPALSELPWEQKLWISHRWLGLDATEKQQNRKQLVAMGIFVGAIEGVQEYLKCQVILHACKSQESSCRRIKIGLLKSNRRSF